MHPSSLSVSHVMRKHEICLACCQIRPVRTAGWPELPPDQLASPQSLVSADVVGSSLLIRCHNACEACLPWNTRLDYKFTTLSAAAISIQYARNDNKTMTESPPPLPAHEDSIERVWLKAVSQAMGCAPDCCVLIILTTEKCVFCCQAFAW